MAREEGRARGSVALVVSVALGVLALAGAASALAAPTRAVLAVLALSACVATGSVVAALVSFRGPRTRASIATLVASLLVLTGIGVGFATASVRQFVESITRQQPEPYEDPSYRFRLTPWDRGTVVYTPQEIASINQRAVAGMWAPDDDVLVLVFVEPSYGRTLEQAAREEALLSIPERPTTTNEQRVRFLDRDAVRLQRVFVDEDETEYEESTFFLHQDRIYQLYAAAVLPAEPAARPWFPAALGSFELLDGNVTDPLAVSRIERDDGPGWRVRDHVYENADFGIRVRGGDVTLFYGRAAREFHPDALVAMTSRRPEYTVRVSGVMVGGRDSAAIEALLRDAFESHVAPTAAPPLVRRVAGREIRFDAYSANLDRTWHYRYGTWTDGERAIAITAWAPTRELTDDVLVTALEQQLDILSAAEMAALRAELAAGPDPWHGVGHGWVMRGGAFIDFEAGVRWQRPDRRWRAHPTDEFDDVTNEILLLDAPELGLVGQIAFTPGPAPSSCDDHLAFAEDIAAGIVVEPRQFGEVTGCLRRRVEMGDGSLGIVATAGDENRKVTIELWGTTRDYDRHADAALAAIDGLEVITPSFPAAHLFDGVYRDERMGYALSLPSARFELVTEWHDLDERVGALVEFARDDDMFGVIAAPRDPTMAPEHQAQLLLAEYYPTLGYSHASESSGWIEREATLGGHAAHMAIKRLPLRAGQQTIYRLVARGVLYVILVEERRRLPSETVAAGFRLLD